MLNIKIIRYFVQEKDRVVVKGYRFLSFVKNMDKNMDKSIGKNLSSNYSQKLLEHAKKSATDPLKTTSEKAIQKTVEAIGGLIDNTIVNKITKALKESPQKFSETVGSGREIPKERYISPEEKLHIIIGEGRLI